MIKINLMKNMKKCSRCGKVKDVGEFHKRGKDKFQPRCKECRSVANPIYHMEDKKYCPQCEETKDKNGDNWQKSCDTKDGWQGICKECRNKNAKEYHEKNREEINKKSREYYSREDVRERKKIYFEEYRDRPEVKERVKKWFEENKYHVRVYKKIWAKEKYHKDIEYRLHSCFSAQLRDCLNTKGLVKDRKCFDIVGYSLEELKEHLEGQFDENMNWENHGVYWHIDHILPKVSFNFNDYNDEDFKKCWSLENLRPLEKIENLRKGDRIEKGE